MEILRHIYDEMVAHCETAAPQEGCGLLAAGADDVAVRAYPIANLDESPVSYTLDPAGHVKALYDAEAAGLHLAAVFHSHLLGPAVPSAADVAGALEPEWAHVIVGPAGAGEPVVRAYRIAAGRVAEEPLVVTERV